jgi:hypothetical protein
MASSKKHTLLERTVKGKPIFYQGLKSIVFQEASNYSIPYGYFDYATYGNTVAFVQEPSVNVIVNYITSLNVGKRSWTFSPINPALATLQIILNFPTTNTENAAPYKPIWSLEYTTADFGGAQPPFGINGTQYNITVNPTPTCYNSEAQVLMEGWYAGPRLLTWSTHNLYGYGDETLSRADSSSPWIYFNGANPIVVSLTVTPFPWQAEWPSPFVSTRLLPAWNGGAIYNIGDVVSLGGFNWLCLAYAGAGYGPYGGYLDGTANGTIYWKLIE